MIEKKIADKVREIRKHKGLTLAHLSRETGLSKGLLSRIENNQVSPPIATLSKIAQGLDVHIGVFFEEDGSEQEKYAVTPKEKRKRITRPGTKIGFNYYSLTQLKSRHVIDPFIVRYPVIEKEPRVLFDHPGEEFLLVLHGEIELVYGKEKIRLGPGDAIHFDSSTPHRGQNAADEESECLVIVVGEEFLK
jgi:transcriptional regulator with XRE-family HTH domain